MLYVSDLFSKFENEKIIHKTITNYYLLFMKRTFVFFATGFEEIEAVGTVDILRRGGMDVVSVSISDTLEVVGGHGLRVLADVKIADVVGEEAEWLVLPGGMPGAKNLYECKQLQDMLYIHRAKGGKIAAICASPGVVLGQLGLLDGQEATCYPGFENLCAGATIKDSRSWISGQFVTANGPSSVTNMCFDILSISRGKDTAIEVMNGMLVYPKEDTYFF